MLAEALAQQQSAQSDLGMAGDLMQSQYAPNSGALGSLAMVAQAYAGKKLRGKAEGREADAMRRAAEASLGAEDQKAEREYAREQRVGERERTRRSSLAQQMGLNRREALEFIETGKVPQAVRGVPMMTNQGLVNVNPYTNEYESVAPRGSAPPQNVQIDESIPPEIRAAIMQHEQNGQPLPDELNVTGRQQAPLLPYEKPPSAIELRRLELAEQSAGDARTARQQAEDARRTAAEAAAAEKAKGPQAALSMWEEASSGLMGALQATSTGPLVGRLPALSSEAQTADGGVAAAAPVLKGIFRAAGEGTFTDKDQELLLRMMPTRTDTPDARKAKMANVDRIIRAKLGVQDASGPRPGTVENGYRFKGGDPANPSNWEPVR